MSLTPTEARDEIMALFEAVWTPTGHAVHYWDTKADVPGISNAAWAAPTVIWTLGRQRGFSTNVRRYEREGVFTVQIFTPFGGGLILADSLVKIVLDAYEGIDTPNGVWFRNVRVNTIGQSGEWFQTNVIADFIYEEVK